jgi:hypothetical protein
LSFPSRNKLGWYCLVARLGNQRGRVKRDLIGMSALMRSESSMEKWRLLAPFSAILCFHIASGVGVKAGERVRVVVRTVDDDTQ